MLIAAPKKLDDRPSLTESQLQILRDLKRFSGIRKYHGLLPDKIAALYDEKEVSALMDESLVERGTILSRCGGQLKGLKLTAKADAFLPGQSGQPGGEDDLQQPAAMEFPELPKEELSQEQLGILCDVYHLGKLTKNGGIAPRQELEQDHGKKSVRKLYKLGLLLYIKFKGADGRSKSSRKGYILSQVGRRIAIRCGVANDTLAFEPPAPIVKGSGN